MSKNEDIIRLCIKANTTEELEVHVNRGRLDRRRKADFQR